MAGGEAPGQYAFGALITKNVPHITEKIFLSLDYNSFKNCLEVSKSWQELLKSETFLRRAKYVYCKEISYEEANLREIWLLTHTDEVKRIISPGLVDVNCADEYGITPLIKAACYGNEAMVKVLLDGGADPDKADINTRWSPLHVAISKASTLLSTPGHTEIIKLLIACGADLNKANDKGWTPLNLAAHYGLQDIHKILLDGGANPNMNNRVGRTPY